jgi:hypothetical protein
MKKLLIVLTLLIGPRWAFADGLTWVTPIGTVGLPLTATEALLGYDAVLKQAIAGASLPVYTDPKGFVSLELGAVGAWPNNGAGVEPYVALGHDIAKEIPALAEYKTVHINVFGRYASEQGKAGVGVSLSYSFGGGTL